MTKSLSYILLDVGSYLFLWGHLVKQPVDKTLHFYPTVTYPQYWSMTIQLRYGVGGKLSLLSLFWTFIRPALSSASQTPTLKCQEDGLSQMELFVMCLGDKPPHSHSVFRWLHILKLIKLKIIPFVLNLSMLKISNVLLSKSSIFNTNTKKQETVL